MDPTGVPSSPDFDGRTRISADMSQYRQEMTASTAVTVGLLNSLNAVQKRMDGMANRQGNKLLAGGFGITAALAANVAVAASYQKQMQTIEATNKVTGTSFVRIRKDVDDLTKRLPVSRSELIGLYTQIQNLGVRSPGELQKVVDKVQKLAAVTGDSPAGLGQGLIEFTRTMGQDLPANLDKYTGALVKVTKEQGVSAQGTLEFANAIGPYTRAVGIGATDTLGFAAAFKKAGADGFAASNTFSQMLADITRSIQNGSPRIAQYANLIGVSVDEFQKMDRAESIVEIFEAIGKKGPLAIRTLDQMGIDGIRAAKAVTQVAQSSGGLRQALSEAQAGAKNPQVDQAAKSAMSGLTDELEKTRNLIESAAVALGDSLLPMVTRIASAFNAALGPIVQVTEALAPILGPVAATSALALMGGGALLKGYKLATTVATAGFAANSGLIGAPVAGFMAARGGPGAARPFVQGWEGAVAQGNVTAWQNAAYGMGAGLGSFFTPGSRGAQGARGAAMAPLWLGEKWWNFTAKGYEEANLPGWARERQVFGNVGRAAQTAVPAGSRVGVSASVANAGMNALSFLPWGRRRKGGGDGDGPDPADALLVVESFKKPAKVVEESLETAAKSGRTFGQQLGATSRAFASALGQSTRASLTFAGVVGKMVGTRALGLAAGVMASPVGLAATGIGIGALAVSKDRSSKQEQWKQPDDLKYAFQGYDEALGRSARTVDRFTDSVRKAEKALPKPTSIDEARRINATEVQYAAVNPKLVNPAVGALRSAEDAAAWLANVKESLDPQTLQQAKIDLLRVMSPGQVEMAMRRFGGMDSAAAGTQLDSMITRDRTKWDLAASGVFGAVGLGDKAAAAGGLGDRAKQALDLRVANIEQRYLDTADKRGAGEANAQRYGDVTQMLGNVARTGSVMEVNQVLARLVDSGLLPKGVRGDELRQGVLAGRSPQDMLAGQLMNSREGQEFLRSLAANGGATPEVKAALATQPTAAEIVGMKPPAQGGLSWGSMGAGGLSLQQPAAPGAWIDQPKPEDTMDPVERRLRGFSLGARSLDELGLRSVVKQATETAPEDPASRLAGMRALSEAAKETAGSLQAADRELARFQAAIGDENDERYKLATEARAQVQFERSIQSMGYSREQRVQSATRDYSAQFQMTPEERKSPQWVADTREKEQKYLQEKESYRQFAAQMLAAIRQYEIAKKRLEEDFQRQRDYMLQDYQRSRARAEEDFALQQQYATEDYQKSRMRAQRDFNIQMQRMNEDAAKSLYDPYTRAQSQFTYSAQNLLDNLQRQSDLIQKQADAVNSLRNAGVSDDVINQLQLLDPKNRQQAIKLAQQIANDPSMVAEFNKAIEGRLDVSKGLTQNASGDAWQRMQDDFERSANDAEEDFNRSMERARRAYVRQMNRGEQDLARALSRMNDAKQQQLRRAAEDIQEMAVQISGTFEDLTAQLIGKLASLYPGVGDAAIREIRRVRAEFNRTAGDVGAADADAKNPNVVSPRIREPKGGLTPPRATQPGSIARSSSGNIFTGPSLSWVAEAGWKEAVVPLSPHGANFLAEMVTMLSRTMSRQAMPGSGGGTYIDQSQVIQSATVVSDDTEAMFRELDERRRRRSLVRPRASR